jgi:hypothetical protein
MLSDLKLDKRLIQRNLKEKTLQQSELDSYLGSLDNIQDKGIYLSDLFKEREAEEEARLVAEEEARLVAEEEARLAEEAEANMEHEDAEANMEHEDATETEFNEDHESEIE